MGPDLVDKNLNGYKSQRLPAADELMTPWLPGMPQQGSSHRSCLLCITGQLLGEPLPQAWQSGSRRKSSLVGKERAQ